MRLNISKSWWTTWHTEGGHGILGLCSCYMDTVQRTCVAKKQASFRALINLTIGSIVITLKLLLCLGQMCVYRCIVFDWLLGPLALWLEVSLGSSERVHWKSLRKLLFPLPNQCRNYWPDTPLCSCFLQQIELPQRFHSLGHLTRQHRLVYDSRNWVTYALMGLLKVWPLNSRSTSFRRLQAITAGMHSLAFACIQWDVFDVSLQKCHCQEPEQSI